MSYSNLRLPRKPQDSEEKKSLWWMRPTWLVTCFVIPIYLVIIAASSERESSNITVRGLWFLNDFYLALGLFLLIIVAVGTWLGNQLEPKTISKPDEQNYTLALWILGGMCFLAYIIWFKDVLFSPTVMMQILTGGGKPTRKEIGSAVGITSFSNFIIPFFTLYSYCAVNGKTAMPRNLRILAWTLVALTFFRVYIWAERLAMIELFCSAAIPISTLAPRTAIGRRYLPILNLAPLFALPLLLAYFGIFEYFRSCQSDTYNGKMDFWSFAAGRLASYYIAALNNGAGLLSTTDWPTFQFENSLGWLHKAPLGVGDNFKSLTDIQFARNGAYLQIFGDPEFSNPSGIYVIVLDMGIPLSILYFFAFGVIAGRLYKGYINGAKGSVMFYPIFFIATLEILRTPYLGDPRVFTACLGCLVALIALKHPMKKAKPPLRGNAADIKSRVA